MAVIVMCIGAMVSVSMHIRCIDAAREAARLAARGDSAQAVAMASRIGPEDARITVTVDGEYVVARVEASSLLPGLELAAEAVAAVEPSASE